VGWCGGMVGPPGQLQALPHSSLKTNVYGIIFRNFWKLSFCTFSGYLNNKLRAEIEFYKDQFQLKLCKFSNTTVGKTKLKKEMLFSSFMYANTFDSKVDQVLAPNKFTWHKWFKHHETLMLPCIVLIWIQS